MKINPDYRLRVIAGENIVIMHGTQGADMTKVISLNDTAKELWVKFRHKDFTVENVVELLMKTYSIPEEIAKRDALVWIDSLKQCKAIL